MDPGSPPLAIPSYLFGPYASAYRKAMDEGRRCAEQYQRDGTLPSPRELQEVRSDSVIITRAVVDFLRDQPAWRLYMVGDTVEGMCTAVDWKDAERLYDLYEAMARQTAWGSLHYAISHVTSMGMKRVALRLESVLHFWEPLERARYLVDAPGVQLSLEELMSSACGWAANAWCPEGGGSVRWRLAIAAERMSRASQEESVEAILRQLPRVLPFARGLKHPDVLTDPVTWRKRLAVLDPDSFDEISAAWPSNLLQWLHIWDKELGRQ